MSTKFDFGDLNPVDDKIVGKREIHPSETNSLKFLRDFAVKKIDNNMDEDHHGYLARVLFVYDSTTKKKGSSAFNHLNLIDGDTEGLYHHFRARIYEDFGGAVLPEPSEIPLNPESEHYYNDLKIVEMHPKFTSLKPNMPLPKPDQIVKVDFEDDGNKTFPIYLNILGANQTIVSRPPTPGRPSESFKKGIPRDLGTVVPETVSRPPEPTPEERERELEIVGDAPDAPKVYSNKFVLLIGDSQMVRQRGIGGQLEKKLGNSGWEVINSGVAGRRKCSRTGSKINAHLKKSCTNPEPHPGFAGWECITKVLDDAKKNNKIPSVIYINLGGNGGNAEDARELVEKLRWYISTGEKGLGRTKTATKNWEGTSKRDEAKLKTITTPRIVWLGAPKRFKRKKRTAAEREVPGQSRKWQTFNEAAESNVGRQKRNKSIADGLKGMPNVTFFNPQEIFTDYKHTEAPDGLHMGESGAKRYVQILAGRNAIVPYMAPRAVAQAGG